MLPNDIPHCVVRGFGNMGNLRLLACHFVEIIKLLRRHDCPRLERELKEKGKVQIQLKLSMVLPTAIALTDQRHPHS